MFAKPTRAIMLMIDTHKPEAPNPATARPKMRTGTEGATAQSKLPISNMPIERRKTSFAGAIERTRPKNNMNAAYRCFVMNHDGRNEDACLKTNSTSAYLREEISACNP